MPQEQRGFDACFRACGLFCGDEGEEREGIAFVSDFPKDGGREGRVLQGGEHVLCPVGADDAGEEAILPQQGGGGCGKVREGALIAEQGPPSGRGCRKPPGTEQTPRRVGDDKIGWGKGCAEAFPEPGISEIALKRVEAIREAEPLCVVSGRVDKLGRAVDAEALRDAVVEEQEGQPDDAAARSRIDERACGLYPGCERCEQQGIDAETVGSGRLEKPGGEAGPGGSRGGG